MRQLFILAHDEARRRALDAIRSAPEGKVVEIKDKTRTLEQNSLLHKKIRDISKQAKWMNRQLSPEQWKTIFISAHSAATANIKSDLVLGIEGEIVNIRESSASMSKKRLSSLIEYIDAWAAENDILWLS